MDKLIEILAGKRVLSLTIVFFVVFAILPSFFLIFIWNRHFFCNIDLWKLLLLSASVGTIFCFFNFFASFLWDEIYIAITGQEGGVAEEDNMEKRFVFYYLASLFLFIIEVSALVIIKCIFPSTTIGTLLRSCWSFVKVIVVVLIMKIIANRKAKKRKNAKGNV
ncbi:MAG: hypothetical protein IJZ53_11100 [Tyzzerella sp.]|nr:hypothetical protein [Tyzzerella sp.]